LLGAAYLGRGESDKARDIYRTGKDNMALSESEKKSLKKNGQKEKRYG